MCGRNRTMNRMAFACFTGVAAFACGLVSLSWYKKVEDQNIERGSES